MCLIKSGKKRKIKINVGEAITSGKAAFQMYYNLWNIHEVRGHYCSDFPLDQGIFKKQNGSQALNFPRAIVH